MSAGSWIVYVAKTGQIRRRGTSSVPGDVWLQAGPGEVVDAVEDAGTLHDVFHWVNPKTGALEEVPDLAKNVVRLKAALDEKEKARRAALRKRLREDPATVVELLERLVAEGQL